MKYARKHSSYFPDYSHTVSVYSVLDSDDLLNLLKKGSIVCIHSQTICTVEDFNAAFAPSIGMPVTFKVVGSNDLIKGTLKDITGFLLPVEL